MVDLKNYKKAILFHIVLNLAIILFVTFASYYHTPVKSSTDFGIFSLHFFILQFSVFGFVYFLSLNKLLFRLVFPAVFIVFSCISFWIYTQDVSVTESLIHASLQTKYDIVFDLITLPFIVYLVCAVATTALIIKLHHGLENNVLKSPLTLVAVAAIVTYFFVDTYRNETLVRRMPFSAVKAVNEYFKKNNLNLYTINKPLTSTTDSVNVVFILGESVRADHLELNGYDRKTTPLLAARKDIISFPNTYTPLTYTAISVPQILTNATLTDDYSAPKYSLIDVLNHANIPTNWIGNQTPEKSYEVFINQSRFKTLTDELHSELSFKKAHDGTMIPVFTTVFTPHKKQFTTIHMMGSHWWYETRYPAAFRKFTPVIKSKHIPSNSKEEMINSYDNTILYLDYFVDAIIKAVERTDSNTIVIYLSDHGEILGENNQWLHAQNGASSENPALFIWSSAKFKEQHPAIIKKLNAIKNKKTNLDFFFPSMLHLFKIEGIKYDQQKVIF
ncbi:phosphoethanolamine transferase [Flavobacterium sp.]